MYGTIQLVDNPFTVVFQLIVGVSLLRLFLEMRNDPQPLPQFILALAVVCFVVLAARVTDADWFWLPDSIQYGLWAAVIITATLRAIHLNKEKKKAGVERLPDFFDLYRNRISWGVGVVASLFITGMYIKTYWDKQKAIAETTQVAVQASTTVTKEASQQRAQDKKEYDQKTDSLGAVMAQLAANDTLILAKTDELKNGQKALDNKLEKKATKTQQLVRDVSRKMPLNSLPTIPPPAPTFVEPEKPKPKKSVYDQVKEKLNKWIRARNQSSSRGQPPTDSLGAVYFGFRPENSAEADTTLLY